MCSSPITLTLLVLSLGISQASRLSCMFNPPLPVRLKLRRMGSGGEAAKSGFPALSVSRPASSVDSAVVTLVHPVALDRCEGCRSRPGAQRKSFKFCCLTFGGPMRSQDVSLPTGPLATSVEAVFAALRS